LRDVAEDAARGRIYLPRADLRRFGVSEPDLLAGRFTEAFRDVMAFESARAGEHYGRARFLLAEEDRATLAPAEAMRLIYEQLPRRITFRRWDVFGGRVALTRPEKAGLAVAAWVRPHLSFLYRLAGGPGRGTWPWSAAASRASPRRCGSRGAASASPCSSGAPSS